MILFSVWALLGCRYGAPLLKFPRESRAPITTDSSGNKEFERSWDFLCLRTGLHTGYFRISKYYDKQGRLTETEHFKNTWRGCCDLPSKGLIKKTYYDTLARIVKVEYKISRGGIFPTPLFDTTYYYKNGVRINSPGK